MTLLFTIVVLAVSLTITMFFTRNAMLSYPSGMFWAILGGYCYTLSVYTWDIHYLLFFGSFGMTLFCILAGFGLREKRDTGTDEDEFIDEKGGGNEQYYGETKAQAQRANRADSGDDLPPDRDIDAPSNPSQRTRDLRRRAKERKSGNVKKRNPWGEFK